MEKSLKNLLIKHGLVLKKAYGQNFLTDTALLDEIVKTLATLPKPLEYDEDEITEGYKYEPGFEINIEDGVFVVTGGSVEYLLDTTYAEDDESMRRFQQFLIREGIIDALREAGATEESTIRMGEWEFDFIE